jgi:hypothetical protein
MVSLQSTEDSPSVPKVVLLFVLFGVSTWTAWKLANSFGTEIDKFR